MRSVRSSARCWRGTSAARPTPPPTSACDPPRLPAPPGVDPSRPSAARVYDYLLGGTDNFASERAAAELLKARSPELVDAAFAHRSFHPRSCRRRPGQRRAGWLTVRATSRRSPRPGRAAR
ncbi:MAG TPA: SAM-dependent methyltransferase [Streptosporangiaceae bacterium]